MEKAKVNGINIAYERRGRGEPLVLIYGYPLDGTTWNEVTSLLENDFDLIIPDLRGMGQSDAVDKMYTALILHLISLICSTISKSKRRLSPVTPWADTLRWPLRVPIQIACADLG